MVPLSFAISKRISAKIIHFHRLFNTKTKFVDRVVLDVAGGKGGNGCVSFNRLSPSKKRPTGGSGGKGGNVIIVADKNVENLNFETFQFKGGDGRHGGSDGLTGRNGNDGVVRVPLGTVVTEKLMTAQDANDPGGWGKLFEDDMDEEEEDDDDDEILSSLENDDDNKDKTITPQKTEADEVIEKLGLDHIFFKPPKKYKHNNDNKPSKEMEENLIRVDLDVHNSYVVVAYGGRAGVGNGNVKRGVGNKNAKKSTPSTAMPGQPGEKRSIELELKIIADIGLVGMPNAGKSTLLSTLTNATPKIASYAFTTLHPNIGVIQYSDLVSCTVADIPGLIEGASENRGLGHEFLRHIERTKVLLYVLDGSQGVNPMSYSSFASRNKGSSSSSNSSSSSSTSNNSGNYQYMNDGDSDSSRSNNSDDNGDDVDDKDCDDDEDDDDIHRTTPPPTRSRGRRHKSLSNKRNNHHPSNSSNTDSSSSSSSLTSTSTCPLAADLSALYHELEMYDPALVEKPALLFINKTDIIQQLYKKIQKRKNDSNSQNSQNNSSNNQGDGNDDDKAMPPIVVSKELQRLADKLNLKIFYGSALKEDGIGGLAHSLRRAVESYSRTADNSKEVVRKQS